MTRTEYQPRAYHIPENGDDIDVDDSNDGDYVVCPAHPNEIIYVFGTDFWQLNDKSGPKGGWNSLRLTGWCFRCSKRHTIPVGSYGG